MNPRLIVCCLVLSTCAAQAHVVFEPGPPALAGSHYKATLLVGHGCSGSATTALRVTVPDGFKGAKPMPKPGWTLVTEGSGDAVRSITWRGGPLPDNWADEFSLVGQLPSQPGPLAFKVLQQCESGSADWADTAEPGAKPAKPAPVIEVLPAEGEAHHHH